MKAIARLRTGALAVLLGITLAACDDTLGPDTPFDPQTTAAAMEGMVDASEDMSDAWGSIALAEGLFENTGSADLLPGRGGMLVPDEQGARRFAESFGTAAFFPSNHLGVTFVWHQGQQQYVAGDDAGAPADGIRIVYYAVDPISGQPSSPLTPLGHVDLRDLSSASSERLGIAVVNTAGESDVTLADYYIDVSYTESQSSTTFVFESIGYLSNGTAQLNFDLAQDLTLSETTLQLTQDFQMDLEGVPASVRLQTDLEGDWAGEQATLSMVVTIRNGIDTDVLEITVDGDVADGVIRHNGAVVARISGAGDEPSFTDADGEPLSSEDRAALEELFGSVQGLIELVGGIFGAVGGEAA